MVFYHHFNLPMDRSPGFGSTSCNSFVLFRLAFTSAPDLKSLTSLHNVTRRSILQKVRDRTLNRAFSACKHRVSGSLSLPSRGAFHLSLTVLFAIGHHRVFSLGGWSPLLPTEFHVFRGTLDTSPFSYPFAYGAFTLFGSPFQKTSARIIKISAGPQPRPTVVNRFGLFPFRSPLLRKSMFLSLPPAT